ncbi:MAG: hypothetical protein AAB429_01615 [Patescibacteria group bacterium]
MHVHNNDSEKGSGHRGMVWMMLPCILLAVIILLAGDKLASSKYLWLVVIGVCVVPHVWMMIKGHGKHRDVDPQDKIEDEKPQHKSGGCCH